MSPPQFSDPSKEVIDPVYLQTQADYHFTLGEAYSLEGNAQKAAEEFKVTLIYDSSASQVRLRLAQEYVKQGLLSEAIEQLESIIKQDKGHIQARMLLGGIYSSTKMYDQAIEQYKEVMSQKPSHTDAAAFLGALYAEQKDYEEAKKYFLMISKDPKSDKAYLGYYYIGWLYSEQGTDAAYKEAEKAYFKSLSIKPDEESTVMSFSYLYDQMKQEEKSLKLLKSFQDQFGPAKRVAEKLSLIYLQKEDLDKALQQLELLEQFDDVDLNTKLKIGLIYIERKRYMEAIDKLEEILLVDPQADKVRFYLGAVYEELKRPKQAIAQFDQIPSGSSYFGEAVLHAAFMQKQLGKPNKAKETIVQAIEKRDDIPQFYAFYASLLDEEKDYQAGSKMLLKALEKFPDNTQLHFFLGTMYDHLNNRKETIASMKRVIEIDAEHVQALNYLAYTYAETGENLKEAEQLAFKALQKQPDDPYIMDTVGWVLFKQRRFEEALLYLEAAYKSKTTESVVAEHLGDAYYMNQLVDKAKNMYLRAVEVETDKQKIAQLRTKIVLIERQQAQVQKDRMPASADTAKPSKNPTPAPQDQPLDSKTGQTKSP